MGNFQFCELRQAPTREAPTVPFLFNFEGPPVTVATTMPIDADMLTDGIRNFLKMFSTAEGLESFVKSLHLTDIKNLMETHPHMAKVLEHACRGNPPLEYLSKWACDGYTQDRKLTWPFICFACKIGLCQICAYPMDPLMIVRKDINQEMGLQSRYEFIILGNLCKTCHDSNFSAEEMTQKHIDTWTEDSPWPLFKYELAEFGLGFKVEGYMVETCEDFLEDPVKRNANGAAILKDSIKRGAYLQLFRFQAL